MTEFLRCVVDKFTFLAATDRLYAPEGVWVMPLESGEARRVRVGVTDFMQQRNGDVAFVSVKPARTAVAAGDACAEIETMKVTMDVAAPVSGTIVQVNDVFALKPETINLDPYGEGWLAEIETANWEADRARLLDPQAYLAVMQSQAAEELSS